MAESLHPAATHHLPAFVTAPGDADVLLTATTLLVVGAILGVGVLFFRLHTLPERIAHKSQKLQFQIVAILGLLALFTHNHAFWVAGLLLAFVDLPDFGNPLRRIAGSLERIAWVADRKAEGEASDVGTRKDRGVAASDIAVRTNDVETGRGPIPGKEDGDLTPDRTQTRSRAGA